MIVVIQCASGKKPDAGHLRSTNGQEVMFVAGPEIAPADESYAYARPDDVSDTGESWRAVLFTYNADPENNPLHLLPAWQLYNNKTYEMLAEHCGLDRLFILSAGWGLVRADFLIPAYDITFSANAPMYKRRRSGDWYDDSNMLPKSQEHIVFFGGKDYVNLFCTLSSDARVRRTVWYNAKDAPCAPGCVVRRFHTTTRTNWHYECAKAFISGKLQ